MQQMNVSIFLAAFEIHKNQNKWPFQIRVHFRRHFLREWWNWQNFHVTLWRHTDCHREFFSADISCDKITKLPKIKVPSMFYFFNLRSQVGNWKFTIFNVLIANRASVVIRFLFPYRSSLMFKRHRTRWKISLPKISEDLTR